METKVLAEFQLRNLGAVVANMAPHHVPTAMSVAERLRTIIQGCADEHQGQLLLQLDCIVSKLSAMLSQGDAAGNP